MLLAAAIFVGGKVFEPKLGLLGGDCRHNQSLKTRGDSGARSSMTVKGAAPADKTTPRGAAVAAPSDPPELSVLVVQFEALEHDEAIRRELKLKGFSVQHQAMVALSPADAREFVLEVCNPRSTRYQLDNAERPPVDSSEASSSAEDQVPATSLESGEDTDHAIEALSSGPILVLGVEKSRGVIELQQLVGAISSPSEMVWAAGNDSAGLSLRSRFGKSARQVGLRCSQQSTTVQSELQFLLSCGAVGGGNHLKHRESASDRDKGRRAASRSATMRLDQLLEFLFPPHQQHPNSAGRLFVFALYGPLDAKSRLHSGEKGLHVVTDRELSTMARRMEREDILAVYGMCSLSQEDEEEVVRQVDAMLKSFPQYSPRDVTALFASLPRDSEGKLSFHDMQRTIIKERCRRVLCMKERLHPALAPHVQNAYRFTITRLMKTRADIAPPSLFLKDVGATGAENATLVTRLLSNHTFEIAHFQDGNSPELTQNVRLLRDDFRPASETRDRWNPN